MKRKFIPILILIPLFLVSCSLFSNLNTKQSLSDAEMATRVAELLSTMTTPTSEIVFPATATLGAIAATPTATQQMSAIIPTATEEMSAEVPTSTSMVLLPTLQATATPEETVTAEPPAEPTPTATVNIPDGDPIKTLGTASGADPLDSNSKWTWPTGSDDYISVAFKDGFMNLTNVNEDAGGWRLPLVAQQTDTYIELTANSGTCSGKDSYGIIFRVPVLKEPDQGYIYQVTCDGYFRLWKWDGKAGTEGVAVSLLNWKQSAEIHTGANQVNRLGVKVVEHQITLFMNGVQVGTVADSTYEAGFFGVFVRSGGDSDYTAKFDLLQYWENPK